MRVLSLAFLSVLVVGSLLLFGSASGQEEKAGAQEKKLPDNFFDGYQAILLGYLESVPEVEPVLYLTRTDFADDGHYIGSADLSNWLGDVIIQGSLGRISFMSGLAINGNLRCGKGTFIWIYGLLIVNKSILLGDDLFVSGGVVAHQNIELLDGDLHIDNGCLRCDYDLSLSSGSVSVSSAADVQVGSTDVSGEFCSNGNVMCTKQFRVDGKIDIQKNLTASGSIYCCGDLYVTESLICGGNVDARSIQVGRDAQAIGRICAFSSDITVGGNLAVGWGLMAAMNITVAEELESKGPIYCGCLPLFPGSSEINSGLITCHSFDDGEIKLGTLKLVDSK
jgi:hypothetical protein